MECCICFEEQDAAQYERPNRIRANCHPTCVSVHPICNRCLSEVMRHSRACPLCRSVLIPESVPRTVNEQFIDLPLQLRFGRIEPVTEAIANEIVQLCQWSLIAPRTTPRLRDLVAIQQRVLTTHRVYFYGLVETLYTQMRNYPAPQPECRHQCPLKLVCGHYPCCKRHLSAPPILTLPTIAGTFT